MEVNKLLNCSCKAKDMRRSWMLMFFVGLLAPLWGAGSAVLPDEEPEAHFVVAADGSGDFTSVQEAIMAVPDFRKTPTIVVIRPGVYKEKLVLPASKTKVVFWGSSPEEVVLTYDDYAQKLNRFGEEMGTTGSSSFFIFGDDFSAHNITFENSAGPVGQAVAVRVSGDRAAFNNCRFLGHQDTLYPNQAGSRQFYYNCYIQGTVDFIFGWATAWFEACTIVPLRGSYITAASTEADTPHGFVFNNCRIESRAPEASVYLGRPWRDHAQTVFMRTYMVPPLSPKVWTIGTSPTPKLLFFIRSMRIMDPVQQAVSGSAGRASLLLKKPGNSLWIVCLVAMISGILPTPHLCLRFS